VISGGNIDLAKFARFSLPREAGLRFSMKAATPRDNRR
jgi:hypothetical protein